MDVALIFAETRRYQSGDDVRCMDWRVTARTGKPHVKVYQTERERPIIFATDVSHSLFFGTQTAFKSVIAAKLTATLAWTAVHQGDRSGGLVFSNDQQHAIRPAPRQQGILPLLNALSKATMPSTTTAGYFNKALSQLIPITRTGSLVFVISDFLDINDDSARYLSRLSLHNDVICICIYDRLEAAAPLPNHYQFSNGQHTVLLDTHNTKSNQEYANQFSKRISNIKQLLAPYAIPLLLINTAEPLQTTLSATFGKSAAKTRYTV